MMSHTDDTNTSFRGDNHQNMNWNQFNSRGFSEQLSPQQGSNYSNTHSFQYIPPQNRINLPPPPLPPPLSPQSSSQFSFGCYGSGNRNVGNEEYPGNINNTQLHGGSFQDGSSIVKPIHNTQPTQPFYGNQATPPFTNYGNQPPQSFHIYDNQLSQPFHSYSNQPPQPFYNYGNQPSQPFHSNGNQPPQPFHKYGDQPSEPIFFNLGEQPSGIKPDSSTTPGGCYQSKFTFQRPIPPRLQPPPAPPQVNLQHRQEINFTPSSRNENGSVNNLEKEEKIWINNWMKNVQTRIDKDENQDQTSDIKISEVQKKLLRYAMLVKELDTTLKHLSNTVGKLEREEWENAVKKSEDLKKQLEEIQTFFDDEQTINKIQEILSKRREKREKWRRGRVERVKKRKRNREERKKREMEMDERINGLNNEEKEKLQEEKMKREADAVLREVRTKQDDVVKMQKMFESLTKLRDVRKKKGDVHGYVEDPRANAFFDKMKSEFDSVLKNQQILYRAEEQTLQVMLGGSRICFPQSKKAPQRLDLDLQQLKSSIFEIYFGKNESKDKEYERSFLACEESEEILVKRRKDWDQFLVSPDDSLGSSVPLGWVVPNTNPNNDWRSFQQSS